MFRVSPLVLKSSQILLFRRSPSAIQAVSVSRTQVLMKKHIKQFKEPEREPCENLPPCPPPPRDDRLLWTTIALFIIAGSFTALAKGNPEIRDWMSINAPWYDEFIAAIYQENKPFRESLKDFANYCKRCYLELTQEFPKECEEGKPVPVAIREEPPKEYVENRGVEAEDPNNPPCCEIIPPEKITKNLCELETCFKEVGENTLHSYMTARDACVFYNALVLNTMKDFSPKNMAMLNQECDTRIELVEKYINIAKESQRQLEDLENFMECAGEAPDAQKESTRRTMDDIKDKINKTRIEFEMENQRSIMRDQQFKMVEEYMKMYIERVGSVYGEADYNSKSPSINGDADFFMVLTEKYISNLTPEVKTQAEIMLGRASRPLKALEVELLAEKPPVDIRPKFQAAYKKAVDEMNKEFADRDGIVKKDNDNELKAMLKEKQDEFEILLNKKLAEKAIEAEAKCDKLVKEKVAAQKKLFDASLAEMKKQLAIVEKKLEAKRRAERETKRARELYMTGMALLRATRAGEDRVCIKKELNSLEKASMAFDGRDPLVTTMLNGIPAEAWEKGIVPESVLRTKYKSMEDVAIKVAMVEADGSPLPVYMLSWIQGVILSIVKISAIPQKEFDNPPKEPFDDLDTFDLLQRARFFLERGNLARAMRYVDSLSGASRAAAATWHDAATAHLQTRQAAEAILAHAAAICLQYL